MSSMAEKPAGLRLHVCAATLVLRTFLRQLARWRLFHVRVYGARHVPPTGGAVVISNHLSFADPPIIWASVNRPMVAVAARELWRIVFIVPVLWLLQCIQVDRGNTESAKKVRQAMKAVVESGGLLLVFPEGKISRDGTLLPFKGGPFDTAQAAKVPVVPAGIAGTAELWPFGSKRLYRRRHVVLVFGQPLDPADYSDRDQFIRDCRDAVAALCLEAQGKLAAVEAVS